MATTYTVLAEAIEFTGGDEALKSSDQITLNLPVKYWQNVDGAVTCKTASVPFTVAADATIAVIDDAITDAIVAYAGTAYGWTIPRTQCIFPQLRRGPVI